MAEGGGDEKASASTPTVFISYASQDAEAAGRICEALRAAGIEVWFDESELRGGDAWDRSIRKQIKSCVLFIPVISRNTHDRVEGYFRLEWKLAVDRSDLIAADQAFLLPVVIDDTRDDDERVPERFREVQWTRLPVAVTPAAFVERVRRLLSGEPAQEPNRTASAAARASAAPSTRKPVLALRWSKAALLATIAVVVVALGYLVANRLVLSKRGAEVGAAPAPAAQSATATAFHPPPHSIAVLPFVNMSGDKEQEYFSDGLSEELLNALSRINELQVAARTSSFYFKGKDVDLGTVARRLNVATVLEGSVRKSAHTVRITAQLSNAVTGFHLWSQTYDRDLSDVLALQTEIANAVTSALKITLLGGAAAKVELGATRNPLAFDAYLRGLRLERIATTAPEAQLPFDAYTEAIRLDPDYALAFAARSLARSSYLIEWGQLRSTFRASWLGDRQDLPEKARVDAERAIALAPALAEGHAALAALLDSTATDFTRAGEESERAMALAPGNATVLYVYSQHAAYMGRAEAAIAAAQRAVALDPLNLLSHRALGDALWFGRRYDESIAAYQEAIAVDPGPTQAYARRGLSYYALGKFQLARASCEVKNNWESWLCLAVTYDKLGQHREAEAQIRRLVEFGGDALAYQYAQIYAQWGNPDKALDWLDTALRLRDPGFRRLKADPLVDPLRNQPRFQAILRKLKFPT
jgi:TolB-like protein/Tfp pilus assembly protein PilF